MTQPDRVIHTNYYAAHNPGDPKSIIKTTRGSNRYEVLPNIMRRLTQNLDGAVVVEAIDMEYGELLIVVTMFPGEEIKVPFVGNLKHPTLITNHEEK